ncbi:uncharacterized protein N7496_005971 [Penicillium cataractarum]|uniref:Rhodopsin domain-containing protein n=1 Tax=Penicillium cataractarum TaxID=2100454 RepID=A0A9W9V6Y1_9EURO|nr:uncharacterized protein N7496_005971 [Penicillium cataractarum]KAJ5369879.1 hypothetical protein N7496_005971 [Penicillium cataractarum]
MAYISASDGSLQPVFLAVMSFLLLLSTTSVLLRLYCRIFLVHKVGPDDYLILSGLIVTIGMGIMNGFHISYGTGRHIADLPLDKILVPTLKHWYVYQLVYPLSIGLVKFSILAQYYRIFAVNRFRKCVIGVGLFVFAYTIIVVFVNAFECRSKPWRAWDPSFPEGCNDLHATYFSTAGINILTDLIILVIPLPLLMKLNLHRRRKYALIAIFLSGTFASAASIVRLNGLYKYTVTKDVSYDAIQILFWSQIEVNVAIISASAPSLRPMFATIFKSSSYARSYGNAYNGPSNNIYGAYGTRSQNRRTMRSGTVGAIELSSRDDENYNGVEVNISGSNAGNGRHGSEERILGPNSNITKTVVVEMKSEHLK